MSFAAAVHAKTIQLCESVLDMTTAAGSGHPTTAMSIAHITTVLMYHSMRWDPEHPHYPTNDRLVLSEGHAVPIVYAAYADIGGKVGKGDDLHNLSKEDLANLRSWESVLDGHPNPREGFPFFDAATGSLGQGLSVAGGLGQAARLDNNDRRIYCIIGDGESREGQIWEAIDFIADLKLTNVLPIFNCNEYGQSERVSSQQSPETLTRKLEAAGFRVSNIDGHNPDEIRDAVDYFIEHADDEQPKAVVARTVKGWGSRMLHGAGWHGKTLNLKQVVKAKEELGVKRIELASGLSPEESLIIQPPSEAPHVETEAGELPDFSETLARADMAHLRSMATRKAYGLALRTLGQINSRIVVMDGDTKNSTFAETFANDHQLAPRYIEGRIAEQNIISAAVGLAAGGKIPFVSSFAKFFGRTYDQVEMAIYSGANVKVVGSHAGISLAADGPSQMGLSDIAFFRAFTTMKDHNGNPGCYLLQPSDAFAAYALTGVMAEYEGFCYMRTLRPDVEFLYNDSTVFNLGGMEVLNEGKDLLLVASGYMVHEANRALDALDKANISATLVDLYSLPFDTEQLLDLAQENNGMIITLEDNYGGGFGAAVADALTEDGGSFTLQQMFVKRIPKSARTPGEMMKMCSLSADDIVNCACEMLQVARV
ncbi:MAG TPA: transketolase [Phycisphaeraceae bacterium]|nr:transketolase [Phycisphaeraceae bacterium]